MRRRTTAALLLLLLSGAVVTAEHLGLDTFPGQLPRIESNGTTTSAALAPSTGDVQASAGALTVEQVADSLDLSPGNPGILELRVANPTSSGPVVLTSLSVEWTGASRTCDRSNLTVEQYDARTHQDRYRIPSGGAAVVRLRIALVDKPVNQDACKGQRFPLTFTAVGSAA